jgi:hypothetical protein
MLFTPTPYICLTIVVKFDKNDVGVTADGAILHVLLRQTLGIIQGNNDLLTA